jgi:hypothetical protein
MIKNDKTYGSKIYKKKFFLSFDLDTRRKWESMTKRTREK